MAGEQDKVQQNVERRELEVKANSLTQTTHGENWFRLRGYHSTNAGQNWIWWQLGRYIKPDSFVFISLTEVDPNSLEPRAHGTVKYIVSSASPRLDFLDVKYEAYNGAEGIVTRVDALIYTEPLT